MFATSNDSGVFIADDLVGALLLSAGKYTGQRYNVTMTMGGRTFSAQVAAPTGDAACAALQATVAKEKTALGSKRTKRDLLG